MKQVFKKKLFEKIDLPSSFVGAKLESSSEPIEKRPSSWFGRTRFFPRFLNDEVTYICIVFLLAR